MKSNNMIKTISLFVSIIILLPLSGCRKNTEVNSYSSSDTIMSFPEVTEDDYSNEVLSTNGESVSSPEKPQAINGTTSSNNINRVTDNAVPQPVESNSSALSHEPDVPSVEHEDKPNLTPLTNAEIKEAEEYFFQLVNEERARVGVAPLTRNTTLDKAANIRVNETLTVWGHTRPNGKSADDVLLDVQYGTPGENIWSDDGVNWHHDPCYRAGRFGEILTNAGSFSGSFARPDMKTVAQNMFDAYKNSEAHYNNMIAGEYNFVGTSIISYKNNGMITCHNITVFTEE